MYTIKTLNSISAKGLERLPESLFEIHNNEENPDAILLRSADMLNMDLSDSLLAIGRAGAGTNNIPIDKCSEQGIAVFNTPGANANAVKELVLGALVLSGRKVLSGIDWVKTLEGEGDKIPKLVEQGKSKFAGPELRGKTLGVIGLGAIGIKVANMALHLGMNVLGYDPYISVDAAWKLSRNVQHSVSLSDVIANSDFITLHLPVTTETKFFLDAEMLAQCKQGVRILNFARSELVDNQAIVDACKTGRVFAYFTDFPTQTILNKPGIVCMPHLGASTPESEQNCAVMAAEELKDYLLNGNIINSVNFPNVSMPRSKGMRVCTIHQNNAGILADLTTILKDNGLNIDNLTNKSKGKYAYTMIDVSSDVNEEIKNRINELQDIIRVRIV